MSLDPASWPLVLVVGALAASALAIGVGGTRLVHVAESLARRTGLGQAVFGAIFLGGTTSLPGIVTSVVAAAQGHPALSVSNAIGGIAAQTVFLVLADLLYRRANLEHAAASLAGIAQGALLIALLAIVLLAAAGPRMTLLGVHPASLLIVAGYVGGMRLVAHTQDQPMWMPAHTSETVTEARTGNRAEARTRLSTLWLRFAALGGVVGGAGFVVARTGMSLAARTGLSETVVGGYLTAIITSLPELVTTVASVRRGALALAVGDILGGNAFDVLFVAFSDVAWDASIYHAMARQQRFLVGLAIFLTAILMLGLLRREKHGIANIGFEGALMLVFYVGATLLLWTG